LERNEGISYALLFKAKRNAFYHARGVVQPVSGLTSFSQPLEKAGGRKRLDRESRSFCSDGRSDMKIKLRGFPFLTWIWSGHFQCLTGQQMESTNQGLCDGEKVREKVAQFNG
jgi:hypothetical protein